MFSVLIAFGLAGQSRDLPGPVESRAARASSAHPIASAMTGADCTHPSYQALTTDEIRAAISGVDVEYDLHGAVYRGALSEYFSSRSSRYEIQYDAGTGMGTYEVQDGRLCTYERGPEFHSCRRL